MEEVNIKVDSKNIGFLVFPEPFNKLLEKIRESKGVNIQNYLDKVVDVLKV